MFALKSVFSSFFNFFVMFTYVLHADMCAPIHTWVEVRRQLLGVGLFLPPCASHGSNSSPQNWPQAPLLSEPSPWPRIAFPHLTATYLFSSLPLLFFTPPIISLGNKLILSKYHRYCTSPSPLPHLGGVEASRYWCFELGSLVFEKLEHWHETLRNLCWRKLFSQC